MAFVVFYGNWVDEFPNFLLSSVRVLSIYEENPEPKNKFFLNKTNIRQHKVPNISIQFSSRSKYWEFCIKPPTKVQPDRQRLPFTARLKMTYLTVQATFYWVKNDNLWLRTYFNKYLPRWHGGENFRQSARFLADFQRFSMIQSKIYMLIFCLGQAILVRIFHSTWKVSIHFFWNLQNLSGAASILFHKIL